MSSATTLQGEKLPTPTPSRPVSLVDKSTPLDDAHVLGDEGAKSHHPLAELSSVRKHTLLFVFAVATFVDICNVSGVGVAVAQISKDIKLETSQITWIIVSYSLCFSSFLLFAGRLADIFRAQFVFIIGFVGLGVLSLVNSFVTSNKFGFLILRGLGGIFGALTIPASYHLTVHMFPDHAEQQKKLALLGIAGGLGNVLGLLIAGVAMLHSYKAFFWIIAGICIVFSGIALALMPLAKTPREPDSTPTWRRLDILGVILMMGALICFILSLTEGPVEGWGSAAFIAPFILSWFLVVAFFVWEAKIPPRTAVLPSSVWKIPNIIIASLAVMVAFPFWATSQLQYATYWQIAGGWTPIKVAAAMLPQGLTGLVVGGLAQAFPVIITRPRITIPAGGLLIVAAELLQIYSDGGLGMNYWKYCFPAYILGSAGAMAIYFASAINIVSYCPPEMGGVIGAWVQVVAQVGGAICLAVQAAFDKDITNWKQSGARAYWFMLAWAAVLCLQYGVFYKQPGTPEEEHEKARKRIMASKGDLGV